jgi:hypothetical protein
MLIVRIISVLIGLTGLIILIIYDPDFVLLYLLGIFIANRITAHLRHQAS